MNTFRKFLTAAAAALTLSAAALTSTPSSAYYYFHHWGYHWGYHAYGFRPALVVGPTVFASSSCPPGTHSGYLGRHCWANH